MANSLIELREEISRTSPRNTPSSVPPPPRERAPAIESDDADLPQEPGDVVLQRTNALAEAKTKENIFQLRYFKEAEDVVRNRVSVDDDYAAYLLPQLETLSPDEYRAKILDEGEKEEVYNRSRENPGSFTSFEAAKESFLNSSFFGQLSRLRGAEAAMSGKDYDEAVYQSAKTARLLERAFPKSNLTGELLSYLPRFTPAGALFSAVGKVTAKKLGKAAASSLTQKAVVSAAEAGAGVGLVEGTKGTLGSDFEGFSLTRGGVEAVTKGGGAAIFGAGVPVVGEFLRKSARAAGKVTTATLGSLDNVIEGVTGTPIEALRAYNKNPQAISKASQPGYAADLGGELKNFLQSKRLNLPERQAADKALELMPDMNAEGFFQYADDLVGKMIGRTETRSDGQRIKGLLDEFRAKLPKAPDSSGLQRVASAKEVSPVQVREWVDRLQNIVDDGKGFGNPESRPYIAGLNRLQFKANQTLRQFAKSSEAGEAGQRYFENMALAAKKRRILDLVSKDLGRTAEAQEKQAEKYIVNMFGKNKTVMQQRLESLDRIYDMDFSPRAKLADYGRQLGPNGVPQILPQQATGRSLLGPVVGGTVGGMVGGIPGSLIGAAATSPRAGALIVGTADRISGFVRRAVTRPETLKAVSQSGKSPEIVRNLAKEVLKTLKSDGPVSAASAMRVIADTPYFVGLVHYFEIADREDAKKKGSEEGIGSLPMPASVALPPAQGVQ